MVVDMAKLPNSLQAILLRLTTWKHQPTDPHDRLINRYALLPENDASFFECFNFHTSILSGRVHFCGIFLNSQKYFQDIFLRHSRDVTEKHLFLDMFETP